MNCAGGRIQATWETYLINQISAQGGSLIVHGIRSQINVNFKHFSHSAMAKFFPWKQHFSTKLTHDVESPSVVVNVQTRASEDTGSKRAGGSLTLSRCMKLGFVLGALSVAIIVGIRLGRAYQNSTHFSQRDHGLENEASRIIGGIEVRF